MRSLKNFQGLMLELWFRVFVRDANSGVFNIESLYENHKDIVSDLYKKRVVYSDKYIDKLLEQNKGIFKDRDELLELIVCTSIKEEKMNNRPMSKLTKDIAIEVGFIKE